MLSRGCSGEFAKKLWEIGVSSLLYSVGLDIGVMLLGYGRYHA